jgi:hypothetical protein
MSTIDTMNTQSTEDQKMPERHIYEIYTKNPINGESGWDIKFVLSTADLIESFPDFDEIITVDDYPTQNKSLVNWF